MVSRDGMYKLQKTDFFSDIKGAIPVNIWYNEIKKYNWKCPNFLKTDRFPKIVWNGVRHLGVGRAFSRDNATMYVVVTYYPGGYLEESSDQNVNQPCQTSGR